MAGRVLKVLEEQGLLKATGKTIVVYGARPKTKTRPVIVPSKEMRDRLAKVQADEDDEDDDE
jgi:CRP/FNR family transcriptional regulator, cyclic AMP receptor protein